MATKINFKTLDGEPVNKRMLIPVIVWAAVYILTSLAIKNFILPSPFSVIVSLIPSVLFIWVVVTFIKYVSIMDELKRRIYLEASAIAFALCLLMIMTLGMLSLVVNLNKEDWDYRHLIPFMFIYYFIGLAITRKKYL